MVASGAGYASKGYGMPRTDDTSYGANYWESFDGGKGYGDSPNWEDIAHLIKEVFCYDRAVEPWRDLSPGFQALDVGCAHGFLVEDLRSRGVETWGLDFSKYALKKAKSTVRKHLNLHDIGSPHYGLYWDPGIFNLVVSLETMEHLDTDQITIALGKIWGALAPGGKIFFAICVKEYSDPYDDPTHVTIKPRAWWEKQLAEVGFEPLPDAVAAIRSYWVFHDHPGIFVGRKP